MTLIRLLDIDRKLVWLNPEYIVEIKPYFVESFGESAPCGTAIWLVGERKVLVSQTPDIIAKTILEELA